MATELACRTEVLAQLSTLRDGALAKYSSTSDPFFCMRVIGSSTKVTNHQALSRSLVVDMWELMRLLGMSLLVPTCIRNSGPAL